MRILVVEDDPVLLDGLKAGLSLAGATVDAVTSCADGLAALTTFSFDAIVLDLMLPDGSGLDLLSDIRSAGNTTPVLLLTALDEVIDRIRGLDAGADDYLGKPFDLDELAARVRAIVRRKAGRATPHLSYNGIVLDPAALKASVAGKAISLSRREFAISPRSWSGPEQFVRRTISKNACTVGRKRSKAMLLRCIYTICATKLDAMQSRRCAE